MHGPGDCECLLGVNADLGDGRNNTANSLLVTGALLGLDVRICVPETLPPSPEVQGVAQGARRPSWTRT